MKAIPIGPPVRYAVVASPVYLSLHGMPDAPQMLTEHKCIQFRYPSGKAFDWYFERGGQREEIVVGHTFKAGGWFLCWKTGCRSCRGFISISRTAGIPPPLFVLFWTLLKRGIKSKKPAIKGGLERV